jgi:hypothetical protein
VGDAGAIPPEAVAALGAHFGVPRAAVPILVRLDVRPGRVATGWAATTSDARRIHLAAGADWPLGRLDIVGALVDRAPVGTDRPFFNLEGVAAVSAYAAQLHVPTGRAMVEVVWPVGERTSRIELTGGAWDDGDVAAAAAAVRWLERLVGSGRR